MSHGAFKSGVNPQISSPQFPLPVFPVLAGGPAYPCRLNQKQHRELWWGVGARAHFFSSRSTPCWSASNHLMTPSPPSDHPPSGHLHLLPGLQQHPLCQNHAPLKSTFYVPRIFEISAITIDLYVILGMNWLTEENMTNPSMILSTLTLQASQATPWNKGL